MAYARGGGGKGVRGSKPLIDDWKKLKTALFGPISLFSYRDCVFLCCVKLPISGVANLLIPCANIFYP